jgi:hypothetical protein
MAIHSDPKTNNLYANAGTPADRNEPIVDFDGPPVPETDADGYRIREEPFGTRRKVRVILMGAGASSLNFFKKAEEEMQNLEVVCYEKNRDIGGTWLENRYPGNSLRFLLEYCCKAHLQSCMVAIFGNFLHKGSY